MTFEEAYQQIRENHYKILDERESISKSARLSLSTWILDILTECREADTPQTEEDYFLELMDAVERGEMSDAEANQAWYEYINKQDTPQTERTDALIDQMDKMIEFDKELLQMESTEYEADTPQTDCDNKDEPQTNGYQTFNGTSVYVSRLTDEPRKERSE